MSHLPEHIDPGQSGEDALTAHGQRSMYLMSNVAIVCFSPFVINAFVERRYALGGAILCVLMVFVVNALALHFRRRAPISFAWLLLPIAPGITISLKTQGIFGAFWCYPTILFFYFVLSRRLAHACALSLLVFASAMVYAYVGSEVAVRFAVSLGLAIIIVTIILDILGDLQRRLLEQAIKDPLTGAFNRRHMDSCLALAIERHNRTAEPVSLLLFDIDHFKRINDDLGHATGDRVLKGLVALVTNRVRRLDLVFRIGGEEFMVLLAGARQADAMTVAEALRASIADAHFVDGRRVSISIGVSEFHTGQTPDSWIKAADDALYAAKQSGRNRVAGSTLTAQAS